MPHLLDLDLNVGTNTNVLIVGDGDFSYSRVLAECVAHLKTRIVATCFESKRELLDRYAKAQENLSCLEKLNVNVIFQVDARNLDLEKISEFDRIVFNFPQSPPEPKKRNQIQKHRELLRLFFSSALKVLKSPGGKIWITLGGGQGGTKAEKISRSFKDSWQIVDMAAESNFILKNALEFPFEEFRKLGYCPLGRRSSDANFVSAENGITHIFVHDDEGIECFDPRIWVRDVSIMEKQDFSVDELKTFTEEIIRDKINGILCGFSQFDQYVDPSTRFNYRGFRIEFYSKFKAVSHTTANEIAEEILKTFSANFKQIESVYSSKSL